MLIIYEVQPFFSTIMHIEQNTAQNWKDYDKQL